MKIKEKLVPFSIAIFLMIYPLRGGDTLGYGFLPSAAALALVVFAFAARPKRRFVLAASDITVLAYFLLLFVSVLVAGASDISIRYLTQIFVLSIVPFFVVRVSGLSLDDAMHFISVFPYVTLLAAASMLVIVGPFQLINYSGYRLGSETFNPVGIANAFGLSALVSFSALKFRLCGLFVGGLSLVVSVTFLMLTASRGPMLVLAVALVMFLLSLRSLNWRSTIAICVLVATAHFVFSALPQAMVLDRFAGVLNSASAQARIETWAEALDTFNEWPFFGQGLGAFEAKHGQYVHNTLLEHMANGGVVLTLPFLIVVMDLARRVFMGASNRSNEILTCLAVLGVYAFGVRLLSLSMANTKEIFLFLAMVVSCSQNLRQQHDSLNGQRIRRIGASRGTGFAKEHLRIFAPSSVQVINGLDRTP